MFFGQKMWIKYFLNNERVCDLGIYFHAQAIGKRIRDGVAFLVAPDPKDYYGGWDAAVRNAEHWFKGAERGRDQMFLPGLSLALAGNPRQRLMNF